MFGHINLKDDNLSVLCLLLVSLCLSIGRNHMGDRGDMSNPPNITLKISLFNFNKIKKMQCKGTECQIIDT